MIKICDDHQEYKVPLIWTFAFMGAEYWCPYCGQTSGMLGAGTDVKSTKTLEKRLAFYEELSKNYLRVKGSQCASSIKWNHKWYDRGEYPEAAKKFFAKAVKDWKYKQKRKKRRNK